MLHGKGIGKLQIAAAALGVLTIVVFSAVLLRSYRNLLVHEVDQRLKVAATAIEWLDIDWRAGPSAQLQEMAAQFGRDTNIRLTIIRGDGAVLADSHRADLGAVVEMEPHETRPELIEASRSGVGSITRRSPTTGLDLRYFARRVDDGGEKLGFVRTAAPIAYVHDRLAALRRYAWLIGMGVFVASIIGTYWYAYRQTAPLRKLTAEAAALASGNYAHRVSLPPGASDEVSALARTLDELAGRIASREEQLTSASQTQATVLEGMTESVIAVDGGERLLFANAAAERTFGFSATHATGRILMEIVRSHELRDLAREALNRRELSTRGIVWQGGREMELEVHATPLPGDPCPGAILVLRDVSELKRLENLRQQFVANVSHELKTPLSSIKAYTETLLGGARNDPVHCEQFLQRIDDQANRLHKLIRDILRLGNIESGQSAFEIIEVPLHRVVSRCIDDYSPKAEAAEVTLVNEVGEATGKVRADEEGLMLIISNLVDNAIKYTPAGGQVIIRSRRAGDEISIEIADTGIGVPPEHHERLFERFYRVDKARSQELGGTGLGLSIVKHLAQAMDGRVSMESTPDHGSTFTVTLPKAAI